MGTFVRVSYLIQYPKKVKIAAELSPVKPNFGTAGVD
jgi:hypothetical protein